MNLWWSSCRGWKGGAALKNESIHFQLLASRAAAFLKTSTYLHLGHRPFTKLWLNFAEKESPERSAQKEARELTCILIKLMVTTYEVYMKKTSCLYVYCTFSVHSLGWWEKKNSIYHPYPNYNMSTRLSPACSGPGKTDYGNDHIQWVMWVRSAWWWLYADGVFLQYVSQSEHFQYNQKH